MVYDILKTTAYVKLFDLILNGYSLLLVCFLILHPAMVLCARRRLNIGCNRIGDGTGPLILKTRYKNHMIF
jgi:hypothetical protein